MLKGFCPGRWKRAEIIPLLKPGKDPGVVESFRPVSLTSVCVKLFKRMIVERLYFWMEREGVVQNWQAGFQRLRGTEEQVLRLVQGIQDGWEERKPLSTIAVTLDCSKAYDRVWRVRLLERLMDDGVPACMVRWFACFLEGRQARVRVGMGAGKWRRFQEGLPQGAVSSPALFLLYANEWLGLQKEGVEYGGFADDLALWTTGRRMGEVRARMQAALEGVDEWAKRNKITLNPSKCECCVFARSAGERAMRMGLKVAGREIETRGELKYLGVVVDQGLTFARQVELVSEKVRRRSRVLRALAGRDWGWDREDLLRVFRACVDSLFWHAAAAWMPWCCSSLLSKLERAQRVGLRVVAGLTKTTPTDLVHVETGVPPVRVTGRVRAVWAWERMVRGREGDPGRRLAERHVPRRLKANKGWREQAREVGLRVCGAEREGLCWIRPAPWSLAGGGSLEIFPELLTSTSTEDPDTRRRAFEETKDRSCLLYTSPSPRDGLLSRMPSSA